MSAAQACQRQAPLEWGMLQQEQPGLCLDLLLLHPPAWLLLLVVMRQGLVGTQKLSDTADVLQDTQQLIPVC